jgi:hypothetical protein
LLSDTTLTYGESFAEALLGLDSLYAKEQGKDGPSGGGDIERLVVLNMSTSHHPRAYGGYADAIADFSELAASAAALPEPDRQTYYRQAVESAIAFATWRSQGLGFGDQISRFLHVPPAPAPDSELDAIRTAMRAILTDLGYPGDIAAQFAAWETRHRVAPEDVQSVLTDLLDQAWDLTAGVMTMPGEKSDGMGVKTVTGAPFNAKCDFSRRTIELNIDPVLTMPDLKHLAVHEGYPGHYVQFKRRENAYRNGTGPADNLLSVVNTASSSPFEGIADVGMSVIGWDRDLDGQLCNLLARYKSGLGTRAAWRLAVDKWTPEQTKDELRRDGYIGGEGWIESRIRFISRSDRAALIWSYWWGGRSVAEVWQRVADRPDRWSAYFDYTYDRMHSIRSHAMFDATG